MEIYYFQRVVDFHFHENDFSIKLKYAIIKIEEEE